jgi:hypothetical protein
MASAGPTIITQNLLSINTVQSGTTWLRKPQLYPTFAEYWEPPYMVQGVSNAGLALRAFLFQAAATDRQSIQQYAGKTTILDARVTCQVPTLMGETVQANSDSLFLNGSFAASEAPLDLEFH